VFGDSAGGGAVTAGLSALVQAVDHVGAEPAGAAQHHAAGVLWAWAWCAGWAVTIFVLVGHR
jgi:hypothetical protein